MHLTIDFETRSEADIKAVGAWAYAEHPSTDVQCLVIYSPASGYLLWLPERVQAIVDAQTLPDGLRLIRDDYLTDLIEKAETIEAHNAGFERAIWRYVMAGKYRFPDVAPEKWRCSMAKCLTSGLPQFLDKAAQAMNLSLSKDMDGRKVMLRMCKPRRPTNKDPSTWCEDEASYAALIRYCVMDVQVEHELSAALPDLSADELDVWRLDQTMNERGILSDTTLCHRIIDALRQHAKRLTAEVQEITGGEVDTVQAVGATLRWINSQKPGLMTGLTRDEVTATLLCPDLPPAVRRVLEVRQCLSRSSTAKYDAILSRANADGRIRGNLVYHGASRTGRWAGSGVQLQNLPRGSVKDVDLALDVFETGDVEMVEMLWDDPFRVASSCVRGMFIPAQGHDFICADFASIEARVLLWLAGDEDGLELFRQGADIYCDMASRIYGRPITKKDKIERQVGKTAILGLGYGMGAEKFYAVCRTQAGVDLADQADIFLSPGEKKTVEDVGKACAQKVVDAYRDKYAAVKALWALMEKAAVMATLKAPTVYSAGKVLWRCEEDRSFLRCRLPSGRRISYRSPRVSEKSTPWGKDVFELRYLGVNTLTKKLEEQATFGGKLVENVDQATSRDLMAYAMLRLEQAGYPVILSVHDEVIAETPEGFGSVEKFERIMSETPIWAEGCPVAAEGWRGKRYRK